MTPQEPVRAAGCVLWRRAPGGGEGGAAIEIALVHRPKYDDWSLPKGKLKRNETPRECAVREVREETGQNCVLGPRLPTARYLANGRPKEVTYWSAEARGGAFTPTTEVDRLLWLPPAAARTRLTQPRDRELLDALMSTTRH
ncbi:NUDIX hydrolase [Streptomyces lateritius]|uniref:NUDIX hydrolase n=1 Tax=Streptomyces lateritius TaxID=67313 RepID=A0ABW6YLD2_9ACTN